VEIMVSQEVNVKVWQGQHAAVLDAAALTGGEKGTA
jgi:hypothetical protein